MSNDGSMSMWTFIDKLTYERRWGTVCALFGIALIFCLLLIA